MTYQKKVAQSVLTCRFGLILTGNPDPSAVYTFRPSLSFSFFTSTLGPLQSPFQRLDLLPASSHLFQKAVLDKPGDLEHGSLEDRFHDPRELGLKRNYSLSHDDNYVW